ALDSGNQSPSGMVTDGVNIWITDDNAGNNKVFVYNLAGIKLGSWTLDAADGSPCGITLNPNYFATGSTTDLWVIDRAAAKVFRYQGGSAWTSGTHSATSSFPLDPGNQHPEGIADPVTLTVQAPPTGSSYPQNSPVLVSGSASPSSGVITGVSVNNNMATLDAANNFFQQVNADIGQTTLSVTGTDSFNASTTSSVTITGAAPVTATGNNPGAIDFSMLSDVTPSFGVTYGQTSFNNGTNVLYANFTAQDTGTYSVRTPFLVGVRHISAPSVRVRGNTGVMPDSTPFYDLSSLVPTPPGTGVQAWGMINPGESTQTSTLSFYDPEGVPFTYDLVFLRRLHHPPRLTSVPVVRILAGQTFNYTATGADPDGD